MYSVYQFFQAIGLGLILLLPLTNPLTTVALWLGLSGNMTKEQRNQQSFMACVYIFIIMTIAFYAGRVIMTTFGISIPGLRIAGGMLVAFIGFSMLFPHTPNVDDPLSEEKNPHRNPQAPNIAFVPLAMPSTAGPGTIAMIISTAASIPSRTDIAQWVLYVAPITTFFLISLIVWLSLRGSTGIMRYLGHSGIDAISRVMGFLLICMGVQFMINGVLEIIADLPALLQQAQSAAAASLSEKLSAK
ncbi:TPA: MarC family NAAT transporter [Proteus mirabilis]|nr:MarC family NAAT transporter [Proteus mirabilis]